MSSLYLCCRLFALLFKIVFSSTYFHHCLSKNDKSVKQRYICAMHVVSGCHVFVAAQILCTGCVILQVLSGSKVVGDAVEQILGQHAQFFKSSDSKCICLFYFCV